MSKKAKIVIARIMALLMVLSILPADLLGTAGVVMAQEVNDITEQNPALDGADEADIEASLDISAPESIGGMEENGSEEGGSEESGIPDASDEGDSEGGAQGGETAAPTENEVDTDDGAADNNEDAEPILDDEADASNAEESADVTYILDPETLEVTSDLTSATVLGPDKYFTVMCNSSKKAKIATIASIQTKEIDSDGDGTADTNAPCYTNLTWPADVTAEIGSGRTKCLAITGGGITAANSEPVNCVKFTVTKPTANVVAYYSPKVKDKTIGLTVAKDNGGKIGDTVGTYGGVQRTTVGRVEIQLTAGTYYLAFASSGGMIAYLKVTEGENVSGGGDDNEGGNSNSTIESGGTDGIISSVGLSSDASFKYADNSEGTPTSIVLKAEQLAETDSKITSDIKTAVATAKGTDEATTSYYDLTLVEKDTDKAVALAAGTVKFKMPYPTGVTNKNRITVLHEATPLALDKITKGTDGFTVEADSFSPYTVIIKEPLTAQAGTVLLSENCGGYEEGAYAQWEAYDGADGYKAYVSTSKGSAGTLIDNMLIRKYKDYWRVDAVGLKKGTYYITVEAYNGSDKVATAQTDALTVTSYDRSGFAFSAASQSVAGVSSFGTGSGAYNDDGTLKSGAQVIYVTAKTAKTCKATLTIDGKPTEVTGLQAILDGKQKRGTEKDILDIRIIGLVKKSDLDKISSSAEGIQIKGRAAYNEMNITLEGIGEDAVVHGFGFLVRNCANVEFRNFAIMAFMDDGVSIDTDNKNIWVHDLDIFYGSTGGDSDQAKGDGSVDVKGKSTFVTLSYNHFWDSGKCSLCGMSDSAEFAVTYHHNWFDHSDSRHPRIRKASVHVYSNYFDGNSKYGVGTTNGSSAFVESNYFRNCKYPMLISMQASDIANPEGKGTFSKEDGGIIKAYDNTIVGAKAVVYANKANGSTAANATAFDAYLAESRTEKVPNTYKTLQGGTSYNNFDTSYDLGVKSDSITPAASVPEVVKSKAGRLVSSNARDFGRSYNAFTGSDADENYDVDATFKSAVVNYKTNVVSIGGIDGTGTGSSGGDNNVPDPDNPDNPDNPTPGPSTPGSIYVHNFTTDGYTSDNFFDITGNKQSNPTTFTYTDVLGNTLTLNKALKMESSTSIKFTAPAEGTLIIVSPPTEGLATKVDGTDHSPVDGIIEVYLQAGSHEITKKGQANIYYLAFVPDGYDEDDVSAPVSTKASGDVPKGTTIKFTCATEGASIYYTLDGTDPSASSTPYTADTEISLGDAVKTVTVKAIAILDGSESTVVTYTYNVTDVDLSKFVYAPTADKPSGTVDKGTKITLSTDTEGATIYYTTNGEDGTALEIADCTEYTAPIEINETTTIWAMAVKGENESTVSKYTYTVIQSVSKTFEFNPQSEGLAVAALPATGTYGTDGYFTIKNDADSKAKIAAADNVAPPEGSKSGSGITAYTSRFQFGGTAKNKDAERAIKFTTYGKAKVTVCAYLTTKVSGSETEFQARNVYLDTDTNKWLPEGQVATEHTFDVEKGAHGIYAKDGDIAILYVVVEDTDVPGVTTPPDDPAKTEYTITVNKADGSATTTFKVNKGSQITKTQLPDPTRDGYTFGGWKDGSGKVITLPYTPAADMTLTASWTAEGGDVKTKAYAFIPENMNLPMSEDGVDSSGKTKYAYTMPAQDTKYGTDDYFTVGNVDSKAKVSKSGSTMAAGNKAGITAFTVRYQFGGKTDKTDAKAIRFTTKGDKSTVYIGAYASKDNDNRNLLLDDQPGRLLSKTPTEYVYTDIAKGDHVIWAATDYYILYVIVEDIEGSGPAPKQTYTITVDKADESATTTFTVEEGGQITATQLPNPTRDGYTFTGWTDGNGTAITLPYTPTGNMTVKATWEAVTIDENKWNITIDKNDGSVPTVLQVEKETEITTTLLPDPTRDGYTFEGWVDGSGTKITLPYKPTGHMTLTAAWKAIPKPKFTITVNKDDGSAADTFEVEEGSQITTTELPDPTKDGYTFDGWVDESGAKITLPYTPTGNMTVKATWTAAKPNKPTATRQTGEVKPDKSVTLMPANGDSDVKIYYTTDGTEPTVADDKLYDGNPIALGSEEKTVVIKAIAVRDGVSSDVAEFTYTIKADAADVKEDIVVTATPSSGNVTKGKTEIVLNVVPKDATVYYTTDGTDPKDSATRKTYTGKIKLNTVGAVVLKVYAEKEDYNPCSEEFSYTVKEDTTQPPNTKHGLLDVELANENEEYIYTGAAIKPAIVVHNYERRLVEGVDYTVKYSNNVKASANGKKAKITVTGKGSFNGAAFTEFTIQPKSIDSTDIVVGGAAKNEEGEDVINVLNGSKLNLVIYNGGVKLGSKDFTTDAGKDKITAAKDVTITGGGNYTGTRTIKVVPQEKSFFQKIAVTSFTDPGFTYDGEAHYLTVGTHISASGEEGTDYMLVYSDDAVNAGKVSVTVVGMGKYTGAVTKKYTIKPIVDKTGSKINVSGVNTNGYAYAGTGVTIGDDLTVTYTLADNTAITLEEGKDYKIAYSGNKKADADAKYTITGIGNFKGSKKTGTFHINKAALGDAETGNIDGLKIAVADKVWTKDGVYNSVPYVSLNDVLVKSSEYTVSYTYNGAKMDKKTNPIKLTDENPTAEVTVTITGKGKNFSGTASATYTVRKPVGSAVDLTKAKIVVYEGSVKGKVEYTGKARTPQIGITPKGGSEIKIDPTDEAKLTELGLTVDFINNVYKGTATVVVNGDGTNYAGGKNANFKIVAYSLKSHNPLTELFPTNLLPKFLKK